VAHARAEVPAPVVVVLEEQPRDVASEGVRHGPAAGPVAVAVPQAVAVAP